MNGSNMRDKARAIFGKTFFENTKEPAPAKNAAVALQKRANARPIPTYKVGGVVKKQAGGALTAAEKARAEAMIRQRGDAAMRDPLVMRFLDTQNRGRMSVPGVGPKAAQRRAEGGGIEAQRLEARAAAGRYKDGGNVQKKAAGGKSMRAIASMPGYSPKTTIGDQAVGTPNSKLADRGIAKGVGPIMMKKMGIEVVTSPHTRKDGGKIAKKAAGGSADAGFNINNAMNTFNQQLASSVKSGKMTADQARKAQAEMTALQRSSNASRAQATEIAQRNLQVGKYAVQPTATKPASSLTLSNVPKRLTLSNVPRSNKKGGEIMKPVKRAVGGAGKTRKGMC
jgi:hypothetical protein